MQVIKQNLQIELPAITRTIYKNKGNSIIQLLESKKTLTGHIIKIGKNYTIIENTDSQIYITNKNNVPEGYDYVMQTNYVPSEKQLRSGKCKFKSWLKNPMLEGYNAEEVLLSWKEQFFYKEENRPAGENGLREPQISALYSTLGALKMQIESPTVVMPTGTGKTETMLSLLVANRCEKLLVTVPSDSLREQIGSKFQSLGLLKQFGIVGMGAAYPIVGIIKSRFEDSAELLDFIGKCNVVISTMAWLTNQHISDQQKLAELFTHVFIDEAHHVKAATWNGFRSRFQPEKIVQFTATPFRNDGKRLDGKIVSNFSLKKAQEQGYYKQIKFLPVREYDNDVADEKISELAIKKLREDLNSGYNHIMMARCATKQRAETIFKLYEKEVDLNPVIVYSGSPNFKESYEKILSKKAKIVVCVDMLGEGFDLPELKIAAFHDIRRSLPITLQFAGRFTRTKYDEQLGDASFIANIADLDVRSELADLYAEDADWNEILSDTSFERINEQVDFKDFMEGFNKLKGSNIPFQNIMPKLSTVVYKNKKDEWSPLNFSKGIPGYGDLEYKFFDLNREQKMLVIITGRKLSLDWVHHKDIHNLVWDITIVFWDTKNNLLFINSSDNGSVYQELAQAIIGDDAELVKGINVFRSFYNIKRVKLQNVGLRQFLGKNIRFRMMVGSDVGEALSLAERQRGEKAFVMGNGFEDGEPVNIGASYKGRIWTKLKGDLKSYKQWCLSVGKKLIDESIDPNQILKETLIPTLVTVPPNIFPVWIDWDVDMYLETESKFKFSINGFRYDLSAVELCLINPAAGGPLDFSLETQDRKVVFRLELFEQKIDGEKYPDFKIIQISAEPVEVHYGTRKFSGIDFFSKYIPTIWFADGSALTGNEFVELKQSINVFPKNNILGWDWTGVNLSNESQHVKPKITDSIQYHVIKKLIAEDNDIVYDDDYSGEIADVVAIKQFQEKIIVKLYHLKYAHGGVISNQIKNFYEVCGQAQKSIHWKHKGGKEFINHLLRRKIKTKNGSTSNRIEKGDQSDLIRLLNVIKNEIPVEFKIYIVQPGVSRANASNEILTLLGVTENYIKEFADIDLTVIGSL